MIPKFPQKNRMVLEEAGSLSKSMRGSCADDAWIGWKHRTNSRENIELCMYGDIGLKLLEASQIRNKMFDKHQ